jgi:hypothetical protein
MKARRDPTNLTAADRREKALSLRRKGWSLRAIAAHLKCGVTTAADDVRDALAELAEHTREYTTQHRELELERLDAMTKRIEKFAREHPEKRLDADESLLKVMQRRAKLLGLDAPTTTQITGANGAPLIPDATDARGILAKAIADAARTAPGGAASDGPDKPAE